MIDVQGQYSKVSVEKLNWKIKSNQVTSFFFKNNHILLQPMDKL